MSKKNAIKEKNQSALMSEIEKQKNALFQMRVDRRIRSAKAADSSAKRKLRRRVARLYTALKNAQTASPTVEREAETAEK